MELKPEDHVDGKSILLQVMTWCRQAGDHYLSQSWPSSMTRYDVPGPQSQCIDRFSLKFSGWVRNHTRNKCSNGDGSSSDSTSQLRNNESDGVSNHRRFDCLLNRMFRRRSKKISKHRVTGVCEGNPSVTGGFLSQRAGNAENVSIWWRHREKCFSILEWSQIVLP